MHGTPRRASHPLRRIIVAGCLAVVYSACVTSPVATEFFRQIGATERHFGLLGGLPMILLTMQFVGAWLCNRVRRRRPWFVTLAIAGRLLYLPVAFLPLWPGFAPQPGLALLIGLIALSAALGHATVPLWFAWMGDLIPHRVLNRYWGVRQGAMLLVWTMVYLAIAVFTFYTPGLPARYSFPALTLIGCAAGVSDILLFLRVREPPNSVTVSEHPWRRLMEPLRDRNYRTLVWFSCYFSGVTNLAAAFMLIYALKGLQLEVWKATVIWCAAAVGNAVVSPMWGRIADRHGHRPVLRICVALKPLIALVFALVTREHAFGVLSAAFFFDAMLNSGVQIASNGFMLKEAPRENRSMFIAANSALSGIAAGLGAIAGGYILEATASFSVAALGRVWNHYHLIFLLSFALRLYAVRLSGRIREPASTGSMEVLNELLALWPVKALLFPMGLYRRIRGAGDHGASAGLVRGRGME